MTTGEEGKKFSRGFQAERLSMGAWENYLFGNETKEGFQRAKNRDVNLPSSLA